MVTITGIEKAFGGRICRYCINSRYGMKLERKDCRYEKYSDICPACKERKHIVKRLTLRGYLRGIGRKRILNDKQAPEAPDPVPEQEQGEERDG